MKEILKDPNNVDEETQKKIREKIKEKWDKLDILIGITGKLPDTIAKLYESRSKIFLKGVEENGTNKD